MITEIIKVGKAYGWKQLAKKGITIFKNRLGLAALGSKSYAYDHLEIEGVSPSKEIQWPSVRKVPTWISDKADEFTFHHLKQSAQEILNGEITLYSYHKIGLKDKIDFSKNYLEHTYYEPGKHFSKYRQWNPEKGDLKNFWEHNRLQFLQPLIAYAFLSKDEEYTKKAKNYLEETLNGWIDQNPHLRSVAWSCGQESSIRCINLYLYIQLLGTPGNEELQKKLANLFYLTAERVYKHIDYARAQRNNHAILEATYLAIASKLFRTLEKGNLYRQKAIEVLKETVEDQFFEDGFYIQNSITYHRFALQALVVASQAVGEEQLDKKLILALDRSYEFLNKLIVGNEKGNFPNYGPNDGTILFNFGNNNYRDLRPLINTLASLIQKEGFNLKVDQLIDLACLGLEPPMEETSTISGSYFFPKSRFAVLKEDMWSGFIRSPDFSSTYPSQNDALNLDLWWGECNIFQDSGSISYFSKDHGNSDYLYACSGKAHNVLLVNGVDPMEKGPRFSFLEKLQGEECITDLGNNVFEGRHGAYQAKFKKEGLYVYRRVDINSKEVAITDTVEQAEGFSIDLFWHLGGKIEEIRGGKHFFSIEGNVFEIEIKSKFSESIVSLSSSLRSLFYHQRAELPLLNTTIKSATNKETVETFVRKVNSRGA